ncbi:JmjC domain protein [Aspergillus campestris IBT 28561]|uniref:JmjC domain protein n=1 Tax=Aspergillus campestris (strain IBT 28561) TaxID=1392248 RepID=A0A2I1CW65_ASPC2|nr:JmjC domain protein [Aspergillus campestris IBT 28561]PKY01855.1 JmjC domain protein [Aspergillus campestris IBT 28561]
MPNQRTRAAFEPISPAIDVPALVESTPNFEYVTRIDCESIDDNGLENFEKLVFLHVIFRGMPLVIEGFNERLDSSLFSEKWLRTHYSTKTEVARNLTTKTDLPLTIGHYLKNMPMLANQWTTYNYKDPERQRIYLKDIDCPQQWHTHLKKIIPPTLFYLNKSREDFQGPGANTASISDTPETLIPKAGDLMSCLPPNMRAENLMCYIGHEGTYTPAHQEMCASLGQNIMVEASDGSIEYGKATKPGSSIWFMTETKDRHVVSEYWLSMLGHDIDIEDHFAQIEAWKSAPFKTYVVEQKPGDFIIIPPLAAHQVWNRGTRTMKVAWNRTTAETLDLALNEALPHARMVCRDEQYKNKAIVFYTLEYYSSIFARHETDGTRTQQLQKDFEHVFILYTTILISECFPSADVCPKKEDVEYIPFDGSITCSYCRGNIFNRFLTCPWCVGETDDSYDICMECFAMGRSCACISKLKWAEQFRWDELTEKHERWRRIVNHFPGDKRVQYNSLLDIMTELQKDRKTLAEICYEQLRCRPWNDISKPAVQEAQEKHSDSESSGVVRKRRKTNGNRKFDQTGRCHICKSSEPKWRLACCSECQLEYCYGSLFRAFNMKPQDVMEMKTWKCPRCEKVCSCAACRRDPSITPFEPTITLPGHDTAKVADPRSVESLVDFRQSNSQWLKKAGDDDIGRLRKHQEEADARRNQSLLDHSIQLEEIMPEQDQTPGYSPQKGFLVESYPGEFGDLPVDPALEMLGSSAPSLPDSRNQSSVKE